MTTRKTKILPFLFFLSPNLTTSLKILSQLFIITDRNNQVKTFCCFWHFLQRFFNVIFRIKASSLKSLCKNRSRDATLCRQSTSTRRRPLHLSLLSKFAIGKNIFLSRERWLIFCRIYSKYLMHFQMYTDPTKQLMLEVVDGHSV